MSTFKLFLLQVLLMCAVGAAQAQSCTDAYEPNDSFATAWGPMTSGGSYSGKICDYNDFDLFKISLTQSGTLNLALTVPPDKDYDLELYNSDLHGVAYSYNLKGESESISYTASTTGTYYAVIYGYSDSDFDTVNPYTLTYTGPGGAVSTGALRFIPLAPCRIADTRNATGPFGGPSIPGQSSRSFAIPNSACSVPSTAAAYSLNITAVPHGPLGYLAVWPSGQTQPLVSTLNASDGRVKANAAIVPAGTSGAISVFVTNTADVVLDINGYFVDAIANPSALAFFPLPPCRVADTRDSSSPLGGPRLPGQQERSFPVLSSNCGIPASAVAYSLNFTAVPPHGLGFLSAWPTGIARPLVSTLNAPTGQVTANAAIVPAGTNGAISVYVATGESDVIIDVNGYFAAAGSGSNPLSLYTLSPCRVLDTRETTGLFYGTISKDATASPCAVLTSSQAVVLNATVVPAEPMSYLCLWPSGQTQPWVSTLNAIDALVTSNMAIVPTTSGVIKAYATDRTHLILDTTGYFASGTDPAPTTYVLTVVRAGTGAGTVNSVDTKINCGGVCAVAYPSGTSVTLTATPTGGSTFVGWSGGVCSGTGSCTTVLSAAKSVTATFNPPGPPGTVTGSWYFVATSSIYGVVSSGYGTLQQNGTTVTGQFNLTGTPCGSSVTLSGTLTGTTFTFQVLEGSQYVSFTGTLNGSYTSASGTYQAPSGGCTQGDFGTWTATKQ